jgi:hypothetical protein
VKGLKHFPPDLFVVIVEIPLIALIAWLTAKIGVCLLQLVQ